MGNVKIEPTTRIPPRESKENRRDGARRKRRGRR
jgi:hypothetical protein